VEIGANSVIGTRSTVLQSLPSGQVCWGTPCRPHHALRAQRSAIGMLQTPPEQRRKFPPIAPDFVIELRSATDSLEMLHVKMGEYMDAGVQLG